MTLILKLLLFVLAGFGAHRTFEPTQRIGGRAGQLARYIIGSLVVLIGMTVIVDDLSELADFRPRVLISGLLTMGAIGTGVGIGHACDALKGTDDG